MRAGADALGRAGRPVRSSSQGRRAPGRTRAGDGKPRRRLGSREERARRRGAAHRTGRHRQELAGRGAHGAGGERGRAVRDGSSARPRGRPAARRLVPGDPRPRRRHGARASGGYLVALRPRATQPCRRDRMGARGESPGRDARSRARAALRGDRRVCRVARREASRTDRVRRRARARCRRACAARLRRPPPVGTPRPRRGDASAGRAQPAARDRARCAAAQRRDLRRDRARSARRAGPRRDRVHSRAWALIGGLQRGRAHLRGEPAARPRGGARTGRGSAPRSIWRWLPTGPSSRSSR